MKKIFTFLIAIFAITLAKAGTFGMGDYVWKDDASQSVLGTNDSYVKNDRKPVDLEMSLGMWTFFKTQGQGTIVLQYARGNANDLPYVAGAAGTTQAQSPNYSLNWVTVNTDSLNKDWVLARGFSTLTEADYKPSGLADYSGIAAFAGPTATTPTNIIDFGGKTITSTAAGITLNGTTFPGFVSGNYNYMKGALRFAIMPGSTVQPDAVYSFRLYTTTGAWDGQTPGNIAEFTINYNHFDGTQSRIIDHASEGRPDPNAVNGGNHFDHGMPIIATGPDILTNIGLPVKWSSAGLQASIVNGQVKLTWATETEINNKEFTVQRSENGSSAFVNIGKVDSKSAGGFSNAMLNYSFTDGAPLAKAIYRIAEVALDGKINYSNSVVVSLTNTNNQLSVYPNPVVSNTLTTKGAVVGSAYRIVNISGNNVAKGIISASSQINVAQLASGVYILQVTNSNGTKESVKFVKK